MSKALDILTDGKTDTELLEAIVHALTENEENTLNNWGAWSQMNPEHGAHIAIVKKICSHILSRDILVKVDRSPYPEYKDIR